MMTRAEVEALDRWITRSDEGQADRRPWRECFYCRQPEPVNESGRCDGCEVLHSQRLKAVRARIEALESSLYIARQSGDRQAMARVGMQLDDAYYEEEELLS